MLEGEVLYDKLMIKDIRIYSERGNVTVSYVLTLTLFMSIGDFRHLVSHIWSVSYISGFSPGHLGVRAPYALHYEPYALILALRFKFVALRVARGIILYVRKHFKFYGRVLFVYLEIST